MEPGYKKADTGNLPVVDASMVNDYFHCNSLYVSAEIRNVKIHRAGRENYGDDAIGYVQLKREGDICTVKAKITPEHKIHSAGYVVSAVVNEKEKEVMSCECHSCAASEGGCKHAVAFLLWLHRRSEEPSVTSVTCYWQKSKLSSIGKSVKAATLKDMYPSTSLPPLETRDGIFLKKYIEAGKISNSVSLISQIYGELDCVKKISLHCLALRYCQNKSKDDMNPDDFVQFCKTNISSDDCEAVQKATEAQNKTTKWYDARYGRLTASKLYEASRCQTFDGTLVESIFGANKVPQTDAVTRGQLLEESVLNVVKRRRNIKIKKSGLIVHPQHPLFAASPDGINEEYCIEIKCPSRDKTIKNYIKENNKLCNKPFAQIQLQMFLSGRKRGLFCVAHPTFEVDEKLNIVEVALDENYIKIIMSEAYKFWKSAIFNTLCE